MSNITAVAKQFFEACEAGKGWEVCQAYCTPNASFSAQAEPLADARTLREYTDWMKGLLTFMPDGRYVVKSFATMIETASAPMAFSRPPIPVRAAPARQPARARRQTTSMSWISMGSRSGT